MIRANLHTVRRGAVTYSLCLLVVCFGLFGANSRLQAQSYGILREVFEGIGGTSVSDLTSAPAYPSSPTSINIVTDYFESPTDILENYGQRMHGYLLPPQTGNYTFWIASDDGSTLYLSTDETPAHMQPIAYVGSWTSSREWTKEGNQQSAPINLQADKPYYICALMKEGGGGDNLAVRWQMPDGTDQAPMVATNLLPWGTVFAAPTIATQPQNTSAVEGGYATFSLELGAASVANYQWRKNYANISGANGKTLSYGPVTMADQGATFDCVVSNSKGTVNSSLATLTVTPDTTPPRIQELVSEGPTKLLVVFTEAVSAPTATTAANYTINGTTVQSAQFGPNSASIELTFNTLELGTTHTLQISQIRDAAATPNPIVAGSSMDFVVSQLAPSDIGGVSKGTDTFIGLGQIDATGTGLGLTGTSDQFHYSYEARTGNFDVVTRVAGFTAPDPWAGVGLMARATLATNAQFAAAIATPSVVGCNFQYRTATGGSSAATGFFPVNYPMTWLRLARAGNVFTGYASQDGVNWSVLSSSTIAMPSAIYLGTVVYSHQSGVFAAAQFRDYGAQSGGVVKTYVPTGEPLGPSTRRTGLAFSEIMYHPKSRADAKEGEFVEIYNGDIITLDLTGFAISGDISYQFPDGFKLAAGAFAVVAKVPGDAEAIYGVKSVLGPYSGSLANGSGTLRLRNPAKAVLLAAAFDSQPPWPAAADGAGHSLVLAVPSIGESNPKAWSASSRIGGSPGNLDPVYANAYAAVVINEILANPASGQEAFVELYNHSSQAVDISGCYLSDSPSTNKFKIPAATSIEAHGFITFSPATLGFAPKPSGETVFLVNSGQTRVIDAVRYGGQATGVASGRCPDGGAEVRALASATPGAANSIFRLDNIVINEIMFHPISDSSDDEYVELYNRGGTEVDLSGWKFTDGISFTFPANTKIGPGAYLVVAKNAAHLIPRHTTLSAANTLGDYQGTLSDSSERIALAQPAQAPGTDEFGAPIINTFYSVVAEAVYGSGGRWGKWSDGGGSSFELIDAKADPTQPSSWADSDETAKSTWTKIETTGVLDNGHWSYPPDQLQMHLLGAGECLVDQVEVVKSGESSRVANGNFESGQGSWVFQGNHRTTSIENSGGSDGGKCLHVRTTGRGDTGANRIRMALSSAYTVGNTVTIRARVRWLKGWPEFLLRLRGNWLEAAGPMNLPTNLGTPGAKNSRAIDNAGPAICDVAHSPVLPAASQNVVVTARVADFDGVGSVKIYYRTDPNTTFSSLTMLDNGTGGDVVAGDGVYSATIPGKAAGTLVAFYVSATDGATTTATARFPSDAPTRECLVRWGETQPVGNLGVYRLWQTEANRNTYYSREPLANDPLDATFVYGNSRVIYNMTMRGKGSPFHGGSIGGDYIFSFPPDDPFLGAEDIAFVTVGNLGSDDALQREQAAFWTLEKMGVPNLHRRFCHFYNNGNRQGTIYEDTEEPDGDYARAWTPDYGKGDLHKIEDWFEFDDSASSFSNVDATLQKFTTTGGALKLARYRWDWRLRSPKDSASNYTNLFALVEAANREDAAYTEQVENQVDIEEWMRVFAVEHAVGNWDAYGYNRGKNMYAYKPGDGRWIMMPWDIDFVLGSSSDGTSTDVFGVNDPVISRMYNHPPFQRAYWRAFRDIVSGPFVADNMGPILDQRYQTLIANGISPVANPTSIKSWVAQRKTYLESRLKSVDSAFAITSNSGNDYSTSKSLITLTGTAPIDVKTIEINGVTYPVTWTGLNTWSLNFPLSQSANHLAITGLDLRGQPVAGSSDTINITYTGTSQDPADYVVINEIQYHPLKADTEFVELYNNSTTTTFDLSGWRLDGADFDFPEGTLLAPLGYQVVVKSRAAFALAFGNNVIPVGEYSGSLDHGGETLKLLRPTGATNEYTLIDRVQFNDKLPWPQLADGQGPSLQLIDPTRDNERPGNWAAAATNATVLATPGAVNSVKASLAAFPKLWVNEVLPENFNGLTDAGGKADPWIELYNADTATISLSGLYLSGSPSNLTQWAFPQSASIAPGQHLLIWADGEPDQSTASELHANFRLPAGTGFVGLSRLQSGTPAAIDYVKYEQLPAGRSYGSIPDGQPWTRRMMHYPTPTAVNNPDDIPVQVFVNEWMASNTHTLADPVDGRYDDWFELYNAGSQAADLSGYYLTDTLTSPAQWQMPTGTVIAAGGYLIVWADGDTSENGIGSLHASFKLSATGEAIALFSPGGTLIDSIVFGQQTNDVSEGRYPDGGAAPFYAMEVATPGAANSLSAGNHVPIITPLAEQFAVEGQILSFAVSARDVDTPAQTLAYSFDSGAPVGASLDSATGVFSWTPNSAQVPSTNLVTIRVTDNGSPVQSATVVVRIVAVKLNHAPTLSAVSDQQITEGSPWTLALTAAEVDAGQTLRFSLLSTPPSGLSLDATSGVLSWTPQEAQGPGGYPISVKVADDGTPSLSATQSLTLYVAEVNAAPQLASVPDQVVQQGGTLTLTLAGTDADVPANSLTYAIDNNSLPGATLEPATGVLTWTPTEAQIPSTNQISVRVTDNGTPALSATRTFQVVATRPAPWKFYSVTGTASASIMYVYLQQAGDLYLDDMKIVAGNQAEAGANTLANGDFESALTGPWTVSANMASSSIVTNVAHAGKGSLHLVASTGGTTRDSSIYQTITPSLAANEPYTLSFWCMPGTNDADLIIRLSGYGIMFSNTIAALPNNTPMLAEIAPQKIPENAAWSLQLSATDIDVVQSLSFSLESGAPTGMKVSKTGLLTWTPTEAQGPSTNTVTVKVTDNGSPALSASRAFTVIVDEVNLAPIMSAIANQTVSEGSLLTFTASAVDSDQPAQHLAFSLDSGAPVGASITAVGVFAWTPTKEQGPGTNKITVRVTDDGSPALSHTQAFTVTVLDVNTAPALEAIPNQTIPEGAPWSLTLKASDTDVPAQTLVFSLDSAPTGMTITPSGVLTWTPTEAQGPSTNTIKVKLTDSGSPAMSATGTFVVEVAEVNAAPVLDAVIGQTVAPGVPFSLNLHASDPDLPAQVLTYSLSSGPAGMTVSADGKLSWTPSTAQSHTTNQVAVKVADSGVPAMSATQSFEIVVKAVVTAPSNLKIQRPGANGVQITWTSAVGVVYRLQYKEKLGDSHWTDVAETTATDTQTTLSDTRALGGQCYYRVVAQP